MPSLQTAPVRTLEELLVEEDPPLYDPPVELLDELPEELLPLELLFALLELLLGAV